MPKERGSKWKLGLFVIIGLVVFAGTIFLVGKQKNLFGSTFMLRAQFASAGGLKEGNNIRFSGINVGTVNAITLSDSFVTVELVIEKDIQQFIKTDATAIIGSDGLMGDKVITINPGTSSRTHVQDGDLIQTRKAIEMDDIMASLKTNVDNAGIITAQLAQFTYKINNGDGILSKVISDPQLAKSLQLTVTNLQNTTGEFSRFAEEVTNSKGALYTLTSDVGVSDEIKKTLSNLQKSSDAFASFANRMNEGQGILSRLATDEKMGSSLDSTLSNIQQATFKLDENMEALQSNFLLRGFFRKKAKEEARNAEALKKAAALKNTKLAEEKTTGTLNN